MDKLDLARTGKTGKEVFRVALLLALLVVAPDRLSAVSTGGPQPSASERDSSKVAALRDEMRQVIGAARDSVFPALVHIEAVTTRYQEGREIKGRSGGSGAIISRQGHVITNQHVIENGKNFKCTLADKRETTAQLIGTDPQTDLAILKLDLEKLAAGANLPVAEFGDSAELEVGDYVLAMGSPFTLARSVSLGIVSNTERVFGPGVGGSELGGIELDLGQRTGIFTRWIQHDAALNPGNSGGPLVNMTGKIVGINELGGDQLGFAIPSNLARQVAAELIAHGSVRRSWLGLNFKPLAGTGIEKGALVGSMATASPAARGGLRVGDLILSLGGEAVTVRYLEEVPLILERISEAPIGSTIDVTFLRGAAIEHAQLVTEEFPRDHGEKRVLEAWGLTVEEITTTAAADLRLRSGRGVLVTGVRPVGPAALAEPPLAAGDVIEAVNSRAVDDLAALGGEYERLTKGSARREQLLLSIHRRGQSYLSVLRQRPPGLPERLPEIAKAWLGITTQPVTRELARLMGEGAVEGYRIARVYPDTTAATAGLQPGDIIDQLNGEPVAPRRARDADRLAEAIGSFDIGRAISVRVVRAGISRYVEVTLEGSKVEPLAAPRWRDPVLEMTVRELTFIDRDENGWPPEMRGVVVEEVEPVGPASLAGLRANDLVQQLGPHPLGDLEDYRKVLGELRQKQPERVPATLLRGSRTLLNYLEPNWKAAAE